MTNNDHQLSARVRELERIVAQLEKDRDKHSLCFDTQKRRIDRHSIHLGTLEPIRLDLLRSYKYRGDKPWRPDVQRLD